MFTQYSTWWRERKQKVVYLSRSVRDVWRVAPHGFYVIRALARGAMPRQPGFFNVFHMRRAVHVVEKVLLNHKLKTKHTSIVATEALQLLMQGAICISNDKDNLSWARSTLLAYWSRYKAELGAPEKIAALQGLFLPSTMSHCKPRKAGDRSPHGVGYEELLGLSRYRRSIRSFRDMPVPVADIKRAMAVALESPSACNRQPFRFRYYSDERNIQAILAAAPGARGYKMPGLILVTIRYNAYADIKEGLCPFIDVGLAVMAFLLALETLGLGSLCMNWPIHPDCDARLREIVALEPDECAALRIGIGYPEPEDLIACSSKRSLNDVLTIESR
jgi:nitroreductase